MKAPLAALLALALLSGCFGKEAATASTDEDQALVDAILGDEGRQKLVDAADVLPKNYSFPGQSLLPPQTLVVQATIASDANGGYEGERDEGGIDYGNRILWTDISSLLPPGQPAELTVRLVWDASEANSADLDIALDVPGTRTSYSATSETWNWNLAVKQAVVDTVGVEGQPARIGVQVSSATVTQGYPYTLEVRASYVKDVLTPYHPWLLDVPSGASGLILESEKAGGDEHVASQFLVIGPEDDLVAFVDFNDLDIPTQSVFVPTPTSGPHVFYALTMNGGFLRVKADERLDETHARPLALVEKATVDMAAPAPGYAAKDLFNRSQAEGLMPKDDAGAVTISFTPEGAFPLRVEAFVRGQVVGMSKITLSSPLGVVDEKVVIGRYADERGTLGYTSEHREGPDHVASWKNLQKGAWSARVVNDSPGVELGHVVLSYTR